MSEFINNSDTSSIKEKAKEKSDIIDSNTGFAFYPLSLCNNIKEKDENCNTEDGSKQTDFNFEKSQNIKTPTSIPENMRFRKEYPKFVHCTECDLDIAAEEWPNHRDRLRKVVIKERLTNFQRNVVRLIIDLVMWCLVNVYFREVTISGLENVPKTGPVVFYGNHQNQFIDAMMIRAFSGRNVRFIIAEKSMHRPIIGHFARLSEAVPVVRPQDVDSTVGKGMIISIRGDKLYGEGTNFKKDLNRGDVITWNSPINNEKCTHQIRNIISDTELYLTLEAKSHELISEPTNYKYSQRIDNSEMYASVYDILSKGQCIGIFPEGGSHDRTSLLPLKAGVALFSLGSAERGVCPAVIPCGLTYFYGHKFRSRAHIEFGEPVKPTKELVDKFISSETKREATGELLKILDASLRNVTINVSDWKTLKFLHSFRRLYQPANVPLLTKDYLLLTRRLSLIINEHNDDPFFADFRYKVENYQDHCDALFVRDSQAATLDKVEKGSWRLLIIRLLMIFVMGIILIPFSLVAIPVGTITHFAAESHARSALSASKVKVVGADVKGSYKIVVLFVVVPIVMNLVSLIVWFFTDLRVALTIFFSLPMAMYVSLLILREFFLEIYAAIPLIIHLFSSQKKFKRLFEKRQQLVELAKVVVAKYDPFMQHELAQLLEDKDYIDACRVPSLFSLRHTSRKLGRKTL